VRFLPLFAAGAQNSLILFFGLATAKPLLYLM